MKRKNNDRLRKVSDKGNSKPKIYAVNNGENDNKVSRGNFLKSIGALGISAAVLKALPITSNASPELNSDSRFDKLTAHSEKINSLTFSPDGKMLVSGSDEKKSNYGLYLMENC